MLSKLCVYLCNEFAFVDVQICTANAASLDLDLYERINQFLASRQSKQIIDGFIPKRHSHEAQAQEPQQSCASWALSIAEPASSWGW